MSLIFKALLKAFLAPLRVEKDLKGEVIPFPTPLQSTHFGEICLVKWIRVCLEYSERAEKLINRKIRKFYVEAIPKKKSQPRRAIHLSPNNAGSWSIRDIYWKSTFWSRFGYLTHVHQTVWGTSGDQKSSKTCAIDRSRGVDVFF